MATNHRCFVSYHQADEDAVTTFIDAFSDVFTAQSLGVSDEDDFIGSDDPDYVMRQIREKYLTTSTVTIVIVGECTKARKYVDWEVASSLRNDANNKRSGLLAINLPSLGTKGHLPARVGDNYAKDDADSYAMYYPYATSKASLRSWIQAAYDRRDTHTPDNSRELRERNSSCP